MRILGVVIGIGDMEVRLLKGLGLPSGTSFRNMGASELDRCLYSYAVGLSPSGDARAGTPTLTVTGSPRHLICNQRYLGPVSSLQFIHDASEVGLHGVRRDT